MFTATSLWGLSRAQPAMVGRWSGHVPARRSHHDDIARSPAVSRELRQRGLAPDGIGILFAPAMLLNRW
jgi:Protein of unknown function (DUF2938)